MAGLQLGALWAFAFVQPLFDLLGRNAQFFAARGNTGGDIVLLALGLAIVPPAALTILEWVARRIRPSLGWATHLALVALLVAVTVLPPAGRLLGGSSLAIVLALATGAGAAGLYARFSAVRPFLTVLSPAPVLFLVLFLVLSPVSKLVFPGGSAGYVLGQSNSSTPVVFVIFDELATTSLMGPGGKIDAEQFPNFARLAARATWYRNATTVAPDTTEAVPALLTGNRPRADELPTAADHPRSIFTLLGRSHDMHVTEPVTSVCPERLCGERRRPKSEARLRLLAHDLRIVALHLLLPDDLRTGLPPVDQGWKGFGQTGAANSTAQLPRQDGDAKEMTTQPVRDFERFLTSQRADVPRPTLALLHVELPHIPWRFLPDGSQYLALGDEVPGLKDEQWVGGQWMADQAFQRHLLQLGYSDRLLGRLLDRLQSIGQLDESIIVVAADHGVSFRSGHPRRAPERENFADIAGIPLLIKAPRQRTGRVDDRAVRTIDVVPAIAKMLRTRLPWRVDGVAVDERRDDPNARIDMSFEGEPLIDMPFGTVRRLRDARERQEERLLGTRGSPYDIGPRPDLIGRRIDALDVRPLARRATVELEAPEAFAAIRPGSGFVPSYPSGAVKGVPAGTDIAIAFGGRVRATTRLRREGDRVVFAAVVPPESLRTGAMSVYPILGGERLGSFGSTTPRKPYRLIEADEGSYIEHGGTRVPIDGAVRGFVDNGHVQDGVANLYGWAAGADLRKRADIIIAFAGGRQLGAVRPTIARDDLKSLDPRQRTAGFVLKTPVPAIRSAGGKVLVFGVKDGHAALLTPVGTAAEVLSSFP